MRRTSSSRCWSWVGAVLLAAGLVAPAGAQDPDDVKRGVARVSLVNGEVSVQRGDSGDWMAATVNAPVVTNDRISTSANSRAEVQFDGANLVRIGGNADVSFSQLEYARYQMALARGTVTFRVLRTSSVDMEVDTPSVSVRPSKQGSYRILVNEAGETEITARIGEVEVFSPTGSQWVRSGQTLQARGSASDPEFQIVRASGYDDWDHWNDNRDQALTRSASSQYVGPGVYGVEDLDPYGSWVDVPGYGYSWRPIVVAGWAPYRQGRWVWEDWYGWTWVSYEPWGWAPYHYGRWFYEPAYGWCWYPGRIGVRHYWSPALVAFFGFGGGGVGFGVGNVGWVPLAPYEVMHPWWGRAYYGRPGYVNSSMNIATVNVTNVYRNARVTNGFSAVSGADFRSGRFNNLVHASSDQLREAGVVQGALPIAPDRGHLQFSERQAAFVPRASGNTKVFTREQPNPVARVPFAEQRRSFEPSNGVMQPALGNPGRSGVAAPQAAVPQSSGVRNDGGGWQRFGDLRGNQPATRVEPATPPSNSGFSRFGYAGGTPRPEPAPQPRSDFRSQPPSSRGGPVAPPVERVRPSGGNAPAAGGGNRGSGSARSSDSKGGHNR